MSNVVRIVVAPRCFVTITPHPSGNPVLRALTIGPGNTADVSPERAAALYRAGLILDPATGALPPPPEPICEGVMTVSINGGRPRPASGGVIEVEPASEALVVPASPFEPAPRSNHDHGLLPRTSVTTYGPGSLGEMASITTADGRSWP